MFLKIITPLTLISSLSFAFTFDFPAYVPPAPTDYYPDRSALTTLSQKICAGVQSDPTFLEQKLNKELEAFFKATVSDAEGKDNSATTANKVISTALPLQLNIIYYTNSKSMSLSLKRSSTEIEAISSISLTENCQLYQVYNTYYNEARRPYLRIKTDAMGQELFRVKMEEPPTPSKISAAGKLKIGIIDSGIDYNHPKLIAKSRPLIGVDLTDTSRPPFDYTNNVFNEMAGRSYSHGTAVADIASRDLKVHLIPVRIADKSAAAGEAIEFLAKKGVRLINLSQGSWKPEEWENFHQAALKNPQILFIVAAGNESTNIDETPSYPATFDIPNMIVVASVNKKGDFSSSFSNYGPRHVHVAAFGEEITAAVAGGGEKTVSGTSFAAPQVTRFAAQILQAQPQLTTQQLKEKILKSARPSEQLKDKVGYGIIEISQKN